MLNNIYRFFLSEFDSSYISMFLNFYLAQTLGHKNEPIIIVTLNRAFKATDKFYA